MRRTSTAVHVLLTLANAGAALALLGSPGTSDTKTWSAWMAAAASQGVVAGYASNVTDYPPLAMTILGGVHGVAALTGLDPFLAFKLSLLVALWASAGIVLAWTRRPLVANAMHAALLLNAIGLAYLDVYAAPTLLLALWALHRDRLAWFSVLFAVSCLTKWQPLLLLPFLLLHAGPRRLLAAILPGLLVAVIVVLTFGGKVGEAFRLAGSHPYLSGNAANLGWVLTHALHRSLPEIYGPLIDGRAKFIVLGRDASDTWIQWPLRAMAYTGYGACLWRAMRDRLALDSTLGLALAGFLAYFTFHTGAHENHLFVPCIVAIVLASVDARWVWPAVGVAVVSNANLALFYGFTGTLPGWVRTAGIDLVLPLAIAEIALFVAVSARALADPE